MTGCETESPATNPALTAHVVPHSCINEASRAEQPRSVFLPRCHPLAPRSACLSAACSCPNGFEGERGGRTNTARKLPRTYLARTDARPGPGRSQADEEEAVGWKTGVSEMGPSPAPSRSPAPREGAGNAWRETESPTAKSSPHRARCAAYVHQRGVRG